VDYVVELQIGGQDVLELLAVAAGENRSSGVIIKSATVRLLGKMELPDSEALAQRK
jgi:hypothetical protein